MQERETTTFSVRLVWSNSMLMRLAVHFCRQYNNSDASAAISCGACHSNSLEWIDLSIYTKFWFLKMENKTKNSYHFWAILEKEIGQKIPIYIKNQLKYVELIVFTLIVRTNSKYFILFYSLNGYGSPNMFKDLTNDDINQIEIYARTQLIELLEAKSNSCNAPLTESLLSAFYSIYDVSPRSFQFVPGDKKFIEKLRVRVADRVNSDGESYFEPHQLARKKRKLHLEGISESLFGLIYGDFCQRQNVGVDSNSDAHFSQDDAQKKLFSAVKKIFGNYEDEIAMRGNQGVSIDSCEVTTNDNNIKGTVTCALCNRKCKVSCKRGTSTWVMANLLKHIRYCLKSSKKENEIEIEIENNNMNDVIVDSSVNDNESVIQLEITPVNELGEDLQSEYEDLVATQIMVQNLKMVNTVFQHKDEELTIYCDFGKKSRKLALKVCDVSADGDCLYSAISHQLSHAKINSKEHQTHTENLRNEVVEHIKSNLPDYIHNLKNRLMERGEELHEGTQNQQCLDFVENQLSQSGTFGGKESFDAICAIKKVNIIIFNENGTCYFASQFNATRGKIIMVAFRGSNKGQKNEERNHFGSVTEIDNKFVAKVSQHLINSHMQYIRNKNRHSIISVE